MLSSPLAAIIRALLVAAKCRGFARELFDLGEILRRDPRRDHPRAANASNIGKRKIASGL
jgi:hypothetical protein